MLGWYLGCGRGRTGGPNHPHMNSLGRTRALPPGPGLAALAPIGRQAAQRVAGAVGRGQVGAGPAAIAIRQARPAAVAAVAAGRADGYCGADGVLPRSPRRARSNLGHHFFGWGTRGTWGTRVIAGFPVPRSLGKSGESGEPALMP